MYPKGTECARKVISSRQVALPAEAAKLPHCLVFPLDSDHFSTRTKPVTLHCDARKLYLPADPQSGTGTAMATAMETAMATAIPMAMRNRCRLPMLIRWKIRTT